MDWTGGSGGFIAAIFQDLLIFSAGVISAIVAMMLGRAAYGLFRPMLRAFGRGARRAGVSTRTGTRPARAATPGAHERRDNHRTAVEWALAQPDDVSAEGNGGAPPALYDFAAEKKILRREGRLFRWLRIPGEFIPHSLSEPFSDAVLDSYLANARTFFSRPVQLYADPNNFYEDEEAGVIVQLLRNTDRRCFYALDQLRRTINANARRFIVWLGALLTILTALAWAAPLGLSALSAAGAAPLVGGVATAVLILVAYGGSTYLLQAFYANQQRQNMREFSDFLTRYLGHIANQFREASAKTSRVIQGDERNAKILSANAQKWHKIMIWLGMRPFFIESFTRNVYFQIRRNLNYYAIGSLIWFVAAAPVLLLATFNALSQGLGYAPPLLAIFLIAAGYAGFAALSIWQIQRKVVLEELNQMNWLGYDNLEVGAQLDEVIGKYAEDIGQWKGRFDR